MQIVWHKIIRHFCSYRQNQQGIDDISIQDYNINSCTENSNVHKDRDYYLCSI